MLGANQRGKTSLYIPGQETFDFGYRAGKWHLFIEISEVGVGVDTVSAARLSDAVQVRTRARAALGVDVELCASVHRKRPHVVFDPVIVRGDLDLARN